MWGWWSNSDRSDMRGAMPTFIRIAILAIVVAIIASLLIGRVNFGSIWWIIFIVPAVFGGASRRRRRRYADWSDEELEAELEKRKNDRLYTEDAPEKNKNAEYRLGADGELVPVDNSLDTLIHDVDDEMDRTDDEDNTFLVPRQRRSGENDRTQYI